MVTSWIDREGNIHKGDNHFEIAEILFPHASNPEREAELAGYIKTGIFEGMGPAALEGEKIPTEAQQEKIAMLWNKHYHKA